MRAMLAVTLLLLAGCSGGSDSSPSPSSTPSTSVPSNTQPPPLVATTDILHLGLPPAMSPLAPTGTEAQETAFPASFGSTGPTDDGGLTWTYTLRNAATLAGTITLHIRVVEPLADLSPLGQSCAWNLRVTAGTSVATGCTTAAAGPIMPGDYAIEIDLEGGDTGQAVPAGTTLEVNAQRLVASPTPNEAVVFLTGTTDNDSRLVVPGLMEPMV